MKYRILYTLFFSFAILAFYASKNACGENREDPKEIIKSALNTVATTPSYSLTTNIIETRLTPRTEINIIFRNDSDLYMQITTPDMTKRIYCNDKESWVYDSRQGKYRGLGKPKTRHDFIVSNIDAPLGYLTEWLSFFLHNRSEILDNANTCWLMPDGELDGKQCNKIKLTYDKYDVYLYLGIENHALLRLEMNLGRQYGSLSGKHDDIIVATDTLAWDTAFHAEDSAFTVAVDDEEIQTNDDNQLTRGLEVHDMIFPMLDGSEKHISEHLGKQVIVLFFWASWCGPCRRAFPVVSKVTKDFRDHNVVCYYININESYDNIRKFSDKNNFYENIVVDSGKLYDSFDLNGVPGIFVIGKDKRIKEEYHGYSESFEVDLRKILTAFTS